MCCVFFSKQKTADELRISDWSSDVCSSDLVEVRGADRQRETVEPGESAFLRRHEGHRLAFLLQAQRRAVPGLAEHHVVLHEAVDLRVGVIPELLDPRLVLDGEDRKSKRELQSLMRISYAVFCLKKKNINITNT